MEIKYVFMKYCCIGNNIIKHIIFKSEDNQVINFILSLLLGTDCCTLIIYVFSVNKFNIYLLWKIIILLNI